MSKEFKILNQPDSEWIYEFTVARKINSTTFDFVWQGTNADEAARYYHMDEENNTIFHNLRVAGKQKKIKKVVDTYPEI